MISSRTRWNPWVVRAFEAVFRPWMRRRLAGVHLAGLPEDIPPDVSVVMAANHVAWWDPFVLRELQRICAPGTPLLTLMREDQLRRFPFFRWMGVVGIDRNAGGLRRALREVASVTEQPPWLTIFPQGRFWPSWRRPLGFSRTVSAFARMLAPAIVLPVGIHYEVMHHPQPDAFANAGAPMQVTRDMVPEVDEVERRVEEVLDQLLHFLAHYGEQTPERWPLDPFSPLPRIPSTHPEVFSHDA